MDLGLGWTGGESGFPGGYGDPGPGDGGGFWGNLGNLAIGVAGRYLEQQEERKRGVEAYDPTREESVYGGYQPNFGGAPRRGIAWVQDAMGRMHAIKDMGTPLLFSGDLAACRRVQRVAQRASRAVGYRRRRGGR